MKRTTLALVIAAALLAAPVSAQEGGDEEAARRRSQARTWTGVGLVLGGLVVPVQRNACLRVSGTDVCASETYAPGVATAAGLITTGALLATVWADVPVRPSLSVERERVAASFTVAW